MDGQTVVGIVVGALFLAGLVGALIPWIPGPLFILIGVLVWAVATQFAVIGVGRLVILVTLALTTLLVNFAAGPIGARPSGGSRRAVGGAIVGALARLLFGPPGLLLGPLVGPAAGAVIPGGGAGTRLR